MPANPRVRDNNVFGSVEDNPLSIGSTLMNSAGLSNLSAIVTKHAVITLDPLRQFGPPEIAVINIHTASATVATILRGQYGTTAREHPQGTLWVHAPINEDFIQIVTSGTRPSDPYEGQFIYETDTDIVKLNDGSQWNDLAIHVSGSWTSWTPTLTNVTIGAGQIQARYSRIGKTINYRLVIELGAGFSMGTDIFFTLPLTASSSISPRQPIGVALLEDVTASNFWAQVWQATTTTGRFLTGTTGTPAVASGASATIPFTWASGDRFSCYGTYEMA